MANLQTQIPLINAPLVDEKGNITEAWFIFLLQLLRRTGGSSGGDGQLTIGDVLALEADIPSPLDISQQVAQISLGFQQAMAAIAAIQQSVNGVGEAFAPTASAASVADQTFGLGIDISHVTEMTFARA